MSKAKEKPEVQEDTKPQEPPTLQDAVAPPVKDQSSEKTYDPPPVAGYRTLTQGEVDLMNECKALGLACEDVINQIQNYGAQDGQSIDPRMLSIGRTQMQLGLMAITRAVAKPESF